LPETTDRGWQQQTKEALERALYLTASFDTPTN